MFALELDEDCVKKPVVAKLLDILVVQSPLNAKERNSMPPYETTAPVTDYKRLKAQQGH